jgi:hypothetical protein
MKKLLNIMILLSIVLMIPLSGLSNAKMKEMIKNEYVNIIKNNDFLFQKKIISFEDNNYILASIKYKRDNSKEKNKFFNNSKSNLSHNGGIFSPFKYGILNPDSWKNMGTEYILLSIGIVGYFVVRRRFKV